METNERSTTKPVKKKLTKETTEFVGDDFESNIAAIMAGLDMVDYNVKTDSDPETSGEKSMVNKLNKELRQRTKSVSSSDSSANEMEDEPNSLASIQNTNGVNPFRSPESLNAKILWQPVLIPFQDRRRLSQCKEEDEDDTEKFPNGSGNKTKAARIKHKFIVTKTENIPRLEANNLKNMTAKQNAATIHFPCSSSTHRGSVMGMFSPEREFNPHLDKKYFDSSLVEIRGNNNSSQSLHTTTGDIIDANVWIPRSDNTVSSLFKYKI